MPHEGGVGTALPSQRTFPTLDLKQKMLRLGRAKIRDNVIGESDMGGSKWLNTVSKCQCEIVMNTTGVFLRDKSSNDILVNSNKVGKDKMYPLEQNSDICFLGSKKCVCIHVDGGHL